MKAQKLPSGSWRIQVTINGERVSITAPTRSEATNRAIVLLSSTERERKEGPTVEQAMRMFVESRRNILSPSTIAQYERFAESAFGSIRTIPVGRLTSADVQNAVNAEACRGKDRGGAQVSAKTVKNEYAFLRSSISYIRPEFSPRVTLPKPVKTFRDLPTPAQVIQAVRGTDIELPALLAMWLSLTASEIRGIKVSSIRKDILTIDETVVQVNGEAVHKKAAKAYDRNRRIKVPAYIMKLIEQTPAWKAGEGYIEPRSGKAISSRFTRVVRKAGLDMRFHDCRHIFASVGLALGVPEKYLLEQGGWMTPATMKNVYQHTYESERLNNQGRIDAYFTGLLSSQSCAVRVQDDSMTAEKVKQKCKK